MIEQATVLRCENVNNQTFILHPGLSINLEIKVFPRAVGNTGKYREIPGNRKLDQTLLPLLDLELFAAVIMYCIYLFWIEGGMIRSCQH